MALHYFHVRTGARVELDSVGTDCSDIAEAKRHALALAERASGDDGDWRIELADAAGLHLASIDRDGVITD